MYPIKFFYVNSSDYAICIQLSSFILFIRLCNMYPIKFFYAIYPIMQYVSN